MDRIPSLHRRTKALRNMPLLRGTVLSYTTVRNPPKGFGSDAYTVVLIEKEDGTKVLAQMTPESALPAIGAIVAPRMRKIRTMENGLFINDLKYEVVVPVATPLFTVRTYVLSLTGPSGVGKTTISRALLSMFSSVVEQVPMVTTHKLKSSHAEPHITVSEEKFQAMIGSGEIIAHTTMTDSGPYLAGYRRKDIESVWQKKKLPVVTTDMQLLEGLAKAFGRRTILSCGLLPPGTSHRRMLSSLLHRLRTRNDSELQIEEQLKHAKTHLKAFDSHAHLFDHMLVNEDIDHCVEEIGGIIR